MKTQRGFVSWPRPHSKLVTTSPHLLLQHSFLRKRPYAAIFSLENTRLGLLVQSDCKLLRVGGGRGAYLGCLNAEMLTEGTLRFAKPHESLPALFQVRLNLISYHRGWVLLERKENLFWSELFLFGTSISLNFCYSFSCTRTSYLLNYSDSENG